MSQLIFKKMNEVMKDIKAVTKDQKNTAQGFKFRGIDQFVNALYPALTKHGVFMTTEVLKQEEQLKDVTRSNGKAGVDKHVSIQMKYTFHAEDGSSVSSSVPAEGLDSGDKATNKALSAALKYALIQTFSIPTEDMAEADFESPQIGSTASTATNEASSTEILTKANNSFGTAGGTGAAGTAVGRGDVTTKTDVPTSKTIAEGLPGGQTKTSFRKPKAAITAQEESEWN